MRIILTGGAGFIGGTCLERMLRAGHAVVVVDTLVEGPTTRAQKRRTLERCATLGELQHLDLDIRAHEDLARRVGRADVIVHLAARPSVAGSMERPADYASVNVLGSAAMLEVARAVGARRVVLASSSSVYGDADGARQREDLPAVAPASPYGASKRAAELFAAAWTDGVGIPVTALRFFTVYGPGHRPDMAAHIFLTRVAQGEPVHIRGGAGRDFVHVDDVARAIDLTLTRATSGFEVYNVGTGVATPLTTLATLAGEAVGRPPQLCAALAPWAGDVGWTCADTSRASAELGFDARVDLAAGLRSTWAWHRTQRDLA